jgi:hypothetical protein
MAFNSDDKLVEDGLQTAQIVLEVAGLFFPPIAVVASDMKTIEDLYQFLSDHVDSNPGLSRLPGPPLQVKNPAKW